MGRVTTRCVKKAVSFKGNVRSLFLLEEPTVPLRGKLQFCSGVLSECLIHI